MITYAALKSTSGSSFKPHKIPKPAFSFYQLPQQYIRRFWYLVNDIEKQVIVMFELNKQLLRVIVVFFMFKIME